LSRAVLTASATALLLVSACGGTVEEASSEPASAITSAGPSLQPASLREACPEVEAAMPEGVIPSAARWQKFSVELDELAVAGDVETKNALENLEEAVDRLAEDPPAGQAYLEAHQALLDAIINLADRCEAVGSSALR
jgi:hypothetical protein